MTFHNRIFVILGFEVVWPRRTWGNIFNDYIFEISGFHWPKCTVECAICLTLILKSAQARCVFSLVLLTNTADSKPRCTGSIRSSTFIRTLFSIIWRIEVELGGIVFFPILIGLFLNTLQCTQMKTEKWFFMRYLLNAIWRLFFILKSLTISKMRKSQTTYI